MVNSVAAGQDIRKGRDIASVNIDMIAVVIGMLFAGIISVYRLCPLYKGELLPHAQMVWGSRTGKGQRLVRSCEHSDLPCGMLNFGSAVLYMYIN